MRNSTKTILGISPGTNSFGIAVLRYGELIDWRIRKIAGTWSDAKFQHILATLESFINRYEITDISIKTTVTQKRSLAGTQLLSGIRDHAKKKKVNVAEFSLLEIMRNTCTGNKAKKKHLSKAMAERFPELLPFYFKEQKNLNAYYLKMFEAVAAASLHPFAFTEK